MERIATAPSKNSSKKKGKKKKKVGKGTPYPTPHDDNAVMEALKGLEIEDIEGVGEGKAPEGDLEGSTGSHGLSELLEVNPRYLNDVYELKQQFGTIAIEEDKREAALAKGKKINSHKVYLGKTFVIVTPSPTWGRPPTKIGGGIGMAMKERKNGLITFEYEYSTTYETIQAQYDVCVQSYDPNSISHQLQAYPYHVDSMILLADIMQATGQMDQAAELTRRALFVLEVSSVLLLVCS